MKRYGRRRKKIEWNARSVIGLGSVLFVLFAVSQVPNFLWIWMWGPDTGCRSAGFTSGHFERKHPAILSDMRLVGLVLVGSGEWLVFDYDLELEEGSASFSVWKWPTPLNRPNRVGPKIIRKSGRGQVEFTAREFGFYRIYMYGHRMQGAVSVDWHTETRHAIPDRGRGG